MHEPFPTAPILIVDDEVHLVDVLRSVLRNNGLDNTLGCTDARDVEAILARHPVSAVLLDLCMPHLAGEELLARIHATHPGLPVIILTAVGEVGKVVECMRAGAFDYLVKPVDRQRLFAAVRNALELMRLRQENTALREHLSQPSLEQPEAFAGIVTQDRAMHALFRYVEVVAPSAFPVLVTGETGVGKELFARALHRASPRAGAFVPVNVAGLDDTMFSDTLFGHVRGAFTGATERREGLIEQAAGGTLFLDEIGDLGPNQQVRLLRLIQEREYRALGCDTTRHSDARIVAATNRNPQHLLQDGTFRKDLFYRLLTHHVHVPPLRERPGDLPLLLEHLLAKAADTLGKSRPSAPPELAAYLSAYSFPGNVRELEAMAFNAVANHGTGILPMAHFLAHMDLHARSLATPAAGTSGEPTATVGFPAELPSLKEWLDLLVRETLRRTQGNQTAAARLMGVTRQTVNRYVRELGIARIDDERML